MKLQHRTLLLGLACALPAVGWAQSTACMVIGAKDAVVTTPQGSKSPVFMAPDCSALKLQTGKAQASWVGRDGKPRLVPITDTGVSSVPSAGSEERSVNVVWSELTSQRERQQPAYMRSTLGADRSPKVYVPADGLALIDKAEGDAVLSVSLVQENGTELLKNINVADGTPVLLPREGLKPDHVYAITLQRSGAAEPQVWRWRMVPQAQRDEMDASLQTIAQDVPEPVQQSMLKAMLYEQLKMRINMDFEVQHLRASGGVAQP